MCSKAPGSKLCSGVVEKEAGSWERSPLQWGRMASGSNRTRRVSHVNSLSPGSSSGNGVPSGPDLGASLEVHPESRAQVQPSLCFPCHICKPWSSGGCHPDEEPTRRGSGCEKPVTPKRVPKQCHVGPPRRESPLAIWGASHRKCPCPLNQKFYFWELFLKK